MKPRQNILIIRLKAIGDVVLTLPAVHAVRENFPDARISFLTVSENTPFLQGFCEVNEVIALDRAALKKPLRAAPEFFRLLRRLRAGKFSLVIDLQGYGETAWLARLTGARERWGTVYGPGRAWAYTLGAVRRDDVHPAEWNLQLLRAGGLKLGAIKNEFVLPAAARAEAEKIFSTHNLDLGKPTLFLQPFTSSAHKNWPLEKYLALADHWRQRGGQVILAGGPADEPLLARARSLGHTVPPVRSRLADAGLMQLATVIVGGDTGFLHLAVALGKRVVMLMHAPSAGSVVPFQHREWVVAAPSGLPVAEIALEQVIAATDAALAETFK